MTTHRDLRPDEQFDKLIETILGDVEKHEEKEEQQVQQINEKINRAALQESYESGLRRQRRAVRKLGDVRCAGGGASVGMGGECALASYGCVRALHCLTVCRFRSSYTTRRTSAYSPKQSPLTCVDGVILLFPFPRRFTGPFVSCTSLAPGRLSPFSS